MKKRIKKILIRIYHYLVSGGIGIMTEYLMIFLLVEFVGLYYLLGETIATLTGTSINFLIQKKWTFRKKKSWLDSAVKYTTVLLFNYCFTIGVMFVTVDFFEWHYLISKSVALFFIIIWNYFLYKNYVYK